MGNIDKILVYGVLNDSPDYVQIIGRCDIIMDGKAYTLESYKPPFVERKNGEWYVDGRLFNFNKD